MKKKIDFLLKNIFEKSRLIGREVVFMELCGTHSQTVAEHGIKNLLPKNVKLVSGPGCPICVTDQDDVDTVIGLAKNGIPIAAYGDAISIPGTTSSLEKERQNGAQVFPVYDVLQALEIRKKIPDLVFWGIGFETTTPMTAWGIQNGLMVFSSHKIFPPAMETLLQNKNLKIDGFIDPGHVSAIIGLSHYEKFSIPQVVAGFLAENVLEAVSRLLDQVWKREKKVENIYQKVVKKNGNPKAQKAIQEVFEVADGKWRGIGMIPRSGLKIKKKYQKQDAEFAHRELIKKIRKNIRPRKSACQCGKVLQGLIEPKDCPLFGKVCAPENPQGACMVSQEGQCRIEYCHIV